MASRATWEYRGGTDQGQEGVLVQFSNGSIQSPDSVNFSLFRNKDQNNLKTKRQRILAAETDRLSYAGNNFSSEASTSNTLCRYFVGVVNKESRKMEVYDAEYFNLQPILESSRGDKTVDEDVTDQASRSYREKVDALIEAFGTNKQKRALNSRKLNQVGSETLSKAMAKAADDIIESKGTLELVKDAVGTEGQDYSMFLPPCDASAETPEDVYKLNKIIYPVEYTALEASSAPFRNVTSEELQEKVANKTHGLFVLQELQGLKELKDDEARDRHARCLWYLDTLIKLSHLQVVKRKDILTPECPNLICSKLMQKFTVETFKNGRLQNSVSGTMKSKIVSYVIALALHISDFQVDLTILQRDMKLKESRILEIAKAMGLKIIKKMAFTGGLHEEGHKVGVLTLPLAVYKPSGGGMKRKKM
ncbi:DNA-directed RNA polymerase I subunit RPA49 [Discoglossus pictus]